MSCLPFDQLCMLAITSPTRIHQDIPGPVLYELRPLVFHGSPLWISNRVINVLYYKTSHVSLKGILIMFHLHRKYNAESKFSSMALGEGSNSGFFVCGSCNIVVAFEPWSMGGRIGTTAMKFWGWCQINNVEHAVNTLGRIHQWWCSGQYSGGRWVVPFVP